MNLQTAKQAAMGDSKGIESLWRGAGAAPLRRRLVQMEENRISINECKRQAIAILKGNWKRMLLICLVMSVCMNYTGTVLEAIIKALDAGALANWEQLLNQAQNETDAGRQAAQALMLIKTIPISVGLLPVIELIVGIFSPMLMYGNTRASVKLANGEKPRVGHLFRWRMLGKAWLMNFVRAAMIVTVGLGMIIGGGLFALLLGGGLGFAAMILILIAMLFPVFVMTIMWNMAEYIWTENENFGPVEVLRESARRMKGYKWKYFLLMLGFFGWSMLLQVVSYGLGWLVGLLFAGNTPALIENALMILLMAPLNVYMLMTHVVFYREVNNRCEKGIPEDELENETDDDDEEDFEPVVEPEQIQIPAGLPPMTADETIAYDMLARHGFSKKQMAKDGVLADYEKLNVHPVVEARWERSHVDALTEKYADDPAMLNGILAVAAEYGSTYAFDAAMNLVDRAIWRGSQPNDMLLIQCSALREALNSPSFADIPAVVSRKQEMIEDMMKRLEG